MNTDIHNHLFIPFLKKLFIFTFILGIFAAFVYLFLPSGYITPALPFLFIFYLSITIIGYYILIKAAQKKFIRFLNSYLLTTIIKLLILITVLVVYIMLNKEDALPFGMAFFILYLCYTFFEVIMILSYSKDLQK